MEVYVVIRQEKWEPDWHPVFNNSSQEQEQVLKEVILDFKTTVFFLWVSTLF